MWETLLRYAWMRDQPVQVPPHAGKHKMLFGLLHGLRCGGATLLVDARGNWKLDYRPALAALDSATAKQFEQELMGYKKTLIDWFNEVSGLHKALLKTNPGAAANAQANAPATVV